MTATRWRQRATSLTIRLVALLPIGCASEADSPPVPVETPPVISGDVIRFVEVGAGYKFSCARRSDGVLYCWGDNYFRVLPTSGAPEALPLRMTVPRADKLAVGFAGICIVSDGDVWCWGSNEGYQAGHYGGPSSDPNLVQGLGQAASNVYCGGLSCCAHVGDSIACWGVLLIDDYVAPEPFWIGALDGTQLFTLGKTTAFGCGIDALGLATCWGVHYEGFGNVADNPTPVELLFGAKDMALDAWHYCFVDSLERVQCAGNNASGELGSGSFVDSDFPLLVVGAEQARRVGVGEAHSCSLRSDGKVLCWGWDLRVGRGPTPADPYHANVVPGLTGVTSLAVGRDHTCALDKHGDVYCWGRNERGQLGDGTYEDRTVPTKVQFPPEAYYQ